MFLQLVLTTTLNPTLLNLSRTLLKNSELKFVSSMFREKQFNDTVEGLTIFVDKKLKIIFIKMFLYEMKVQFYLQWELNLLQFC